MEDTKLMRIKEIAAMPEISGNFSSVRTGKLSELVRGKTSLTDEEITGILSELTQIRNKIRKAIDVMSTSNLKAALKDARLHPTIIVGSKVIYQKCIGENGRTELLDYERQDVKVKLLAFYNKIRI